MKPLMLVLPENEAFAASLARAAGGDVGRLEVRRFPDQESYVRIEAPVTGRPVILVCSLHSPDTKVLQVLFAAATAKELGARSVGLVAPYLAYMRQDRRFHEGEAVTSLIFGRLLSGYVDWLVTVDPHLHRHPTLEAVYQIPSTALHAAPLIATWIRENVPDPVLIGPDSESAQWVESVAALASAPWTVLEKIRTGDKQVSVSVPHLEPWKNRTPVLVDDIISTARTQIAAVGRLKEAGMRPPVCMGVHALFAGDAYTALQAAGAGRIVTCNTIPHPSNAIDLAPLMGRALGEL
ncbi:MAG: ribose-phosphate pyrophosphokinase [Planctomycetota bacterium]